MLSQLLYPLISDWRCLERTRRLQWAKSEKLLFRPNTGVNKLFITVYGQSLFSKMCFYLFFVNIIYSENAPCYQFYFGLSRKIQLGKQSIWKFVAVEKTSSRLPVWIRKNTDDDPDTGFHGRLINQWEECTIPQSHIIIINYMCQNSHSKIKLTK